MRKKKKLDHIVYGSDLQIVLSMFDTVKSLSVSDIVHSQDSNHIVYGSDTSFYP